MCKAFCQSNSVVFDIIDSYFAQTYAHPGCASNNRSIIPSGTTAQTIFGYEWRSVTGNPGAGYYGKNPLVLSGIYSPTGGWHKLQDSFTIKYPFKTGYKYDIIFECTFDDGDPNYGPHPPILQVQLTNTPNYTYGKNCFNDPDRNTPEYDLTRVIKSISSICWYSNNRICP
jgi:hypothetical protein